MAPTPLMALRTAGLRMTLSPGVRVGREAGPALLDIGQKAEAVDRAIKDIGGGKLVVAEGGHESQRVSVALRPRGEQALAPRAAAVAACSRFPVRGKCSHLTAAAGLTPNRRAAARRLIPSVATPDSIYSQNASA